uniref:Group 1 truncated hemoglobin LI410 n=1 Tax=Chlamydomonas moewusii TaxID=3054 RepID=TRHN2_CHLMO|nr:RecName: Full=Group 1 truncated hemoglobin LI410; Short=Truncated Hb; AltName: Full=Globin LI410; Flags: Precursor [Chlamydomonas moewusii]CAA51420.1 Li410p [Chlamydomonas moewusii]
MMRTVQLRTLRPCIRAQQQPVRAPTSVAAATATTPAPTKKCPFSLFAKLGGREAVEAAVDKFYNKVVADPTVSVFFSKTDMKVQRSKQFAFLAYALGGAAEWKGKDMRTAHKDLVPHLTDVHFQAVVRHLSDTLAELGVTPGDIADAMAVVASTKTEVLNMPRQQGAESNR